MRQIGNRVINSIIVYVLKAHPTFAERLASMAMSLRYEMPVAPTHYYSPLPDIPSVKNNLRRWYKRGSFTGIDFCLDKQKEFLGQLEAYKAECDGLPNFTEVTAKGYGLGYGEVEAHLLHCMIRHFKPRIIVEVGSGVSTYFTLNAVQMNSNRDNSDAEVICIEPYPSPKLKELVNENKIVLYEKEVQDIGIELFQSLGENDILFIDSTHVSKVDSDVNWLYLEVLPNLRKGVLIHIHDIPFPYLTFMPEHPLFTYSLLWNEAALVKAFLIYNTAFEVLMCQSYLHYESPESIRRVVSIYDERKHFPASLWLMKRW